MRRATSKTRAFAERLVAYETSQNGTSRTKTPAPFFVGEKLLLHLAPLMGIGGFHALLSRALLLTSANFAWLRGVRANEDGSLEGVDDLEAQVAPEEIVEGKVALLAQFLDLLVAFIGEKLTLRFVSGGWPKLSLDDLDLGYRKHK